MKKLILFFFTICCVCRAYSQTTGYIRNDTIKLTNATKSTTVILETPSKGHNWYLKDIGNGRLQFVQEEISDINHLQDSISKKANDNAVVHKTGVLAESINGDKTWLNSMFFTPTVTGSTGINSPPFVFAPTVAQSGSANYNLFQISPYIQSLGGSEFGSKLLDVGYRSAAFPSGTHTTVFTVLRGGLVSASGANASFSAGNSAMLSNLVSTPRYITTGVQAQGVGSVVDEGMLLDFKSSLMGTNAYSGMTTITIPNAQAGYLGIPTFQIGSAVNNSTVTVTDASTLTIAGAPIGESSFNIFTNKWAFRVASGNSYFAGKVKVNTAPTEANDVVRWGDLGTGYVPYTGATADLNMGQNSVIIGNSGSIGSPSTPNGGKIQPESVSMNIMAYGRNGIKLQGVSSSQIASFNDANGGADNPGIIFNQALALDYTLPTTQGGEYVVLQAPSTSPGGNAGILRSIPLSNLATKAHLDSALINRPDSTTISGTYIKRAGDTMLGDLQLYSATPTGALSAVPKSYVDNAISGITWKGAVRAKTTGNITLSGTQTIDGVSVAAGDRVLVANETDQKQNGIYIASASSWTRSIDADSGDEIATATVAVTLGALNRNTQWTNIDNYIPVIGTDNIDFGQISGAGTYTADGSNIILTGNVFALNQAPWSRVTSTPTTISGYGITDAYTKTVSDAKYEVPLIFSTGLTRSTNTIINNLITGIAGGQTIISGTASGNNLTLSTTSNSTKGKILFGTSAYDESTNRLAIGKTTPTYALDVVSSGLTASSENVIARFGGDAAPTGSVIAVTNTNASNVITSMGIRSAQSLPFNIGSSALSNAITIDGSSGTTTTNARLIALAGIQSATNSTSSNFFATNGSDATTALTTSGLLFGGASSVQSRVMFNGTSSTTLAANNSYSNFIVGSSSITTPATGTHAWLTNAVINPLGTVTSGGAAITNTATLYVNGASSAGTNNYALYSPSGTSYFGGNVFSNTAFVLPNTVDQTTNYERLRIFQTPGSAYAISSERGGTGTYRNIKLSYAGGNTEFEMGSINGSLGTIITQYASGPSIQLRRYNGTFGLPIPISSGDQIGGFYSSGATNSSGGVSSNVGAFQFVASENWSASANGTLFNIATTSNGATARTERFRIYPSGNVAIQNGGTFTDNGTDILQLGGSINATAPTYSTGGYSPIVRNSTTGRFERVDMVVTNSTTTGLSSATLTSTYPSAPVGFQVICDSITSGGTIYVKATGTKWLTISAPVAP